MRFDSLECNDEIIEVGYDPDFEIRHQFSLELDKAFGAMIVESHPEPQNQDPSDYTVPKGVTLGSFFPDVIINTFDQLTLDREALYKDKGCQTDLDSCQSLIDQIKSMGDAISCMQDQLAESLMASQLREQAFNEALQLSRSVTQKSLQLSSVSFSQKLASNKKSIQHKRKKMDSDIASSSSTSTNFTSTPSDKSDSSYKPNKRKNQTQINKTKPYLRGRLAVLSNDFQSRSKNKLLNNNQTVRLDSNKKNIVKDKNDKSNSYLFFSTKLKDFAQPDNSLIKHRKFNNNKIKSISKDRVRIDRISNFNNEKEESGVLVQDGLDHLPHIKNKGYFFSQMNTESHARRNAYAAGRMYAKINKQISLEYLCSRVRRLVNNNILNENYSNCYKTEYVRGFIATHLRLKSTPQSDAQMNFIKTTVMDFENDILNTTSQLYPILSQYILSVGEQTRRGRPTENKIDNKAQDEIKIAPALKRQKIKIN